MGGFFYEPHNWRGFYDFGCGALGDMACHILGAPNMALHLSNRRILSVECVKKEGVSPFQFPKASVLRFDFAAYGNMPPVKLFWYDGLKEAPKLPGVPEGEWLGDPPSVPRATPPRTASDAFQSPGRVFNWEEFQAMKASTEPLRFPTPDGSLFIGDKGSG